MVIGTLIDKGLKLLNKDNYLQRQYSIDRMELLGSFIVFSLLVFTDAGNTTYDDIQSAVKNGLPWVNPPAPKPRCTTDLCQDFQKMCQNGGKCEMTPECGASCKCPNGFTGHFCGVKVKDIVTVGLDLLHGTKKPVPNKETNIATTIAHPTSETTSKILHALKSTEVPTSAINKRSAESTTETVLDSSTRLAPDRNYKVVKKWMSIFDKLLVVE